MLTDYIFFSRHAFTCFAIIITIALYMVRRIKIFSAADYDCNKIDLFSLQISERCGREEVSILVLDSQIQTECLW